MYACVFFLKSLTMFALTFRCLNHFESNLRVGVR